MIYSAVLNAAHTAAGVDLGAHHGPGGRLQLAVRVLVGA
jgi:hypothetical protein